MISSRFSSGRVLIDDTPLPFKGEFKVTVRQGVLSWRWLVIEPTKEMRSFARQKLAVDLESILGTGKAILCIRSSSVVLIGEGSWNDI